MKTNVSVELTDEQRDALANMLDGKQSARLLTRKDVNEMVAAFMASMVDAATSDPEPEPRHTLPSDALIAAATSSAVPRAGALSIPDPEDRERLAGRCPSYVTGWNKVKRKLGARA